MFRLISIALLVASASAMAADKKPATTYVGTVTNFTEERYNEPRVLGNTMDSCANRDSTVEVTKAIYVLRQSTCNPNLIKALRVVIGTQVNLQEDKGGRIGILDTRGKPHWYKVFKVTQK